jgi:peptide/nickel transport system ATP-binding protein
LSKIIAGYLTPQSGQILLDGKPLPKKGFCPIQLIHQHPEKAVNPRWKIKKILAEAWMPDKSMLDEMGIAEQWLDRYPNELSGGEMQRFCITRALAPQTRCIIADEMSTMLDMITQAQIWDLMLANVRKRNISLLAVTHNLELAKKVCTRMIEIHPI